MNYLKFLIANYGILIFWCLLLGLFFFVGLKSNKKTFKQLWFNLAAIVTALFLFEIYSLIKDLNEPKAVFSGTFFDNPIVTGKKEFLGYGPKPDSSFQVSSTCKKGDKIIYEALYTIHNGKRLVPNNNDSARYKAFFLGCSVTYGDGLNDNQTLPYFFSEYTKHKFNVTNYGFSGYGTHQALMVVEHEILKPDSVIFNDSDIVVYSFIPEHFGRTAGKSIWDDYGPYFKIENNKLVYKGTFYENRFFHQNYFTKNIRRMWKKSNLYKNIIFDHITIKDVRLVGEIIKTIHQELQAHNLRFIVLVRKSVEHKKKEQYLLNMLKQNGIEYFMVDSILKTGNINQYRIPGDVHPNEDYNKKVAEFLAKNIAVLN